jgi:hypothetical protein
MVALGYIGFKYASILPDWLTLLGIFFIIAATMLQNDWRDRVHDIGKGKTLAHNKPSLFLSWLLFFWIASCVLITIIFLRHPAAAAMLLVMAFIGSIYSETRQIPLLPVTLVSLTVASPLLLSLAFGAKFTAIANIFIATILIMFGRETLHDIADTKVDIGYKKTVPIVMGHGFARMAATTALIVGCIFGAIASPVTIIGSVFILWGLTFVSKEVLVVEARRRIDIGLLLLALGLLLW